MKNITVTVDDETYRRARIKAAEKDTSVSALVRQFLTEVAADESRDERLRRLEAETRAQITDFVVGDMLSRDEVHERGR
ncbi:hypothetical protein ASD38_17215 [Caulobacter sp. Root487D2Y]|jgi:hypothetical protein|uniref:hypothetical protein n=1 Tax=Caulobacter sp. Root487D2Y TaxID=1736547 RepID=UPI0007016F9C|nr:hypothetical protein [Caulobacter sp. Root487D2Y]KQY27641.1 hypothetical protein ASD38_17215 [Caulobacter sp. Root487D2Y]